MKTVYKYKVNPEDSFCIRMPAGAEVLTVQMQHGVPHIWALVNPDRDIPVVARRFHLVGTGQPFPNALGKFIGTFQILEVNLVLHLFEELDKCMT